MFVATDRDSAEFRDAADVRFLLRQWSLFRNRATRSMRLASVSSSRHYLLKGEGFVPWLGERGRGACNQRYLQLRSGAA